jgi:hypothetical protein
MSLCDTKPGRFLHCGSGAWIAQAGRFSIALALLVAGAVAVSAMTFALRHDERHR